jgi:hypothetical protein
MTWTLAFNTKGAAGAAGTPFLAGSGAPTTGGVAGQGYVDTTNAYLYTYTNGTWVQGKNLIGPMGLNGVNGSFFAGVGAPTTSTYSGTAQAVYIQSTGEVWLYQNQSTGWVDSGESLVGPQGNPGVAGTSTRGSQIFEGSGPPSTNYTDTTVYPIPPVARDLWFDTTNGIYYTFS